MKIFLFTLFLTFLCINFASEMLGLFHHPDHPGKCVLDDLVLSPGERGQPKGKCATLMCSNDGGFGIFQDCGVQGTGPSCRLGDFIKPNAPYPDCCERHTICD